MMKSELPSSQRVVFTVLFLLLIVGCGGSDRFVTSGSAALPGQAATPTGPVPARLGFITQPARAGEPFATFQVGVYDENGELVAVDGIEITVTSSEVTLLGTTTKTTSQGIAIFDDVYTETASSVTVTASSPGLEGATSVQFVIGPNDPHTAVPTLQPGNPDVGTPLSFSLLVTDRFGNPIPGLVVDVELLEAVLDVGVPATGSTTATTDAQGVATFDALTPNESRTAYLSFTVDGLTVRSEQFSIFPPAVLGQRWRVVSSQTTFDHLAAGNGMVVGVAENGLLLRSTDGVTFETSAIRPAGIINRVTYGGGLFVAVGSEGGIYTSPDGLIWIPRDSSVSSELLGVRYLNGQFFSVGRRQVILASPDGVDWELLTSDTGANLKDIAYGNGVYVVVGVFQNLTTQSHVLRSSDGINWSGPEKMVPNVPITFTMQGHHFLTVIFAEGRFVAVSHGPSIITSTDGLNWVSLGTSFGQFVDVAHNGETFVAANRQSGYRTSVDASSFDTWVLRTSPLFSALKEIATDGATFFGLSAGGFFTSTDQGITWAELPVEQLGFNQVFVDGNRYVGRDAADVYTSEDGVNFTLQGNSGLQEIAEGDGLFMAVGTGGGAAFSSDLVSWTPTADTGVANGTIIRKITFGDSRFIAAGHLGTILRFDQNGSFFGPAIDTGGDESWRAVAHGNGTFVIVGRAGVSSTSSDNGDTWSTVTDIAGGENLEDVRFLNNQFIAVGDDGTVLSSSDGMTWDTSIVTNSTGDLNSITFSDGLYVAVGDDGVILTSPDLVSWTSENSPFTDSLVDLLDVAGMNGQFVAVAAQAAIVSP